MSVFSRLAAALRTLRRRIPHITSVRVTIGKGTGDRIEIPKSTLRK